MTSRQAFEKWAEDKSFVLNIREHYGYVSVREMAWDIWQAAQAQVGNGESPVAWHVSNDPNEEQGNHITCDGEFASSYEQMGWRVMPLYTSPPAAVNQQLLSDIINMMIAVKGAIKLGQLHDAVNYIDAAIAAAQEQSQ